MHELSLLLGGTDLSFAAAVARLCLSLVACGMIGLEREIQKQTAGWRTHIVIGIGATLLMMLSIWLPQMTGEGDSARIAAQVVSGIGFLGAGAFLKIGNNVKGLTTAATLWFCAGLGLTIGAGMWKISLVALGIIFVALIILDPLEARLFPKERLKNLVIWCTDGFLDRAALDVVLEKNGIIPQSIDASESHKSKHTRLSLLVRVPLKLNLGSLFADIRATGQVSKIRLFENY
ncbi:MAG: hypothetical protein A2087_12670 [Spirochaetes bacterium GWD1_61_31]|nr:MAG: hypothetical protein A2Y37_11340 [Spirochaetes bacterium GWB1_60_80]OHD32985.1 MAG: hypothetical protein A2004_07225 [Spirochaetes bacterium GWC1_61_12]OHD38369.1 MAG: hypothetical protein A2087_12670 [Spirochaetes bacterium GWD1_61_31]OHD43364.1 MAG: hypothetical protein A2Y35_02110 [Spirochaetes bacterium GWE1_60_18]OHD58895.1 MAG: hypothetical protein A2Y32_10550 [Spirochaetes bacterium GWF1_60_12]